MTRSSYSTTEIFRFCRDFWPETHTTLHRYLLNLHRLAEIEMAGAAEIMAGYGLSVAEFDILAALRRSNAPHTLNPTGLQRSTLLSSGGTTKLLYQLERRGYICRSVKKEDKRSKLVHLTPFGRQQIEQAMNDVLSQKQQAAKDAGMTQADLKQLNSLLEKRLSV